MRKGADHNEWSDWVICWMTQKKEEKEKTKTTVSFSIQIER